MSEPTIKPARDLEPGDIIRYDKWDALVEKAVVFDDETRGGEFVYLELFDDTGLTVLDDSCPADRKVRAW
jgi:hypothetical protein